LILGQQGDRRPGRIAGEPLDDGPAPQGIIAAALLHREVPFATIRAILVAGKLVECEGEMMRNTERGREMAARINAVVADLADQEA
jgi:hypothetical protein